MLLAYSGGVASGAMLSLVAEGVREGTAKKRRFRPGAIVYVDESSATSVSSSGLDDDAAEENSRREILESLSRHCRTIFGQESVDGGEVEKGSNQKTEELINRSIKNRPCNLRPSRVESIDELEELISKGV